MGKEENKYWQDLCKNIDLLQGYLGIKPDIDLEREIFFPYYLSILEYINKDLVQKKSEGKELKDLVQAVFDIYDEGTDRISVLRTDSIKEELIKYPTGEVYNTEHMAFTWGHVLTSLCVVLRMVYAYLFEDPDDDCCCCTCPNKKKCCRNTTADYESWVSNVYPEDDCNYVDANFYRANSPWQSGVTKYNDCYRHTKEDDGCACSCRNCKNKE